MAFYVLFREFEEYEKKKIQMLKEAQREMVPPKMMMKFGDFTIATCETFMEWK